jgi:hypothetical protein
MLPSIGSLTIGKLGGQRRHAERTSRSSWLYGCPLAWCGKASNPTAPAWHLVLDPSAPANLDHRGSWPERVAHTAALACLVGGIT